MTDQKKKYDKAGYPWPNSESSRKANLIGYHNHCSFCGGKPTKEMIHATDEDTRLIKWWR